MLALIHQNLERSLTAREHERQNQWFTSVRWNNKNSTCMIRFHNKNGFIGKIQEQKPWCCGPFSTSAFLPLTSTSASPTWMRKKCSPWHRGGGSLPKEAVSSQCAELIWTYLNYTVRNYTISSLRKKWQHVATLGNTLRTQCLGESYRKLLH